LLPFFCPGASLLLGVFYLYFLFHKTFSGARFPFEVLMTVGVLRGVGFLSGERKMVSNFLSETRGAGFTHPLSLATLLSASTRPCVSFAI